jgi:predicted transcriptional regulator
MPKRTHAQIRQAILKALSNGKEHSYGELERIVDTNWQTVRNHCADLEMFKAVIIKEGKVKITEIGREALRKMQKK